MIKRPLGLIFCETNLIFNYSYYLKLEVDLDHIQLGKSKTRSSSLTLATVMEIAELFINNQLLYPESEAKYGSDICEYFSIISNFKTKKYKLVFCICTDRPHAIGILTLHRI